MATQLVHCNAPLVSRQRSFRPVPPQRFGSGARSLQLAVHAEANPASEKYDYILVGGGTAGCVLANRLTADPSKKVLVLEAGGENTSRDLRTPAGLPRLFKSALDWNLYTNLQKAAEARQVYIARGKVLGGSSSTNATLYMRGTSQDYDGWNMPGWGSKEALHGFIKCEDNDNGAKDGVHGRGGPMHVENPRYQNKLHDVFFQAAEEAGIPKNPNFNDWGHSQEGYGEFQVCQERGVRADAHRQYLKPVAGRSNLTVVTHAKTLGVNMEKGRGQTVARGVTFSTNGPDSEKHSAELTPTGEVVMCAGAVHTPHLLQLSGIGNGDTLRHHDVEVRVELPGVGQNLQDHPAAVTGWTCPDNLQGISVTDELIDKRGKVRLSAILNYLVRGRGPLATTGCDHGALISTRGNSKQPDLQMRFVPAVPATADGINAYVKFAKIKEAGDYWPSGWALQLLNVKPKSRGTVLLKSDNPWDTPKLDPRYLTDEDGADLATLRNGIKLARQVAATSAMQRVTNREMHPGGNVQSDEDLDHYIRTTLHSGNALVGTCAMGLTPENGAVVDADLRVYGVRGLRVADSSVIPNIPGGQTGAATIMVAERAAEILLRNSAGAAQERQPELALA